MSESNVVETINATDTNATDTNVKAKRQVRPRPAPKTDAKASAPKTDAPKAKAKAKAKTAENEHETYPLKMKAGKSHPYFPLFVTINKGGFAPPKGTDTIRSWMVSGIGNHAKKGTEFPRARHDAQRHATLSPGDAVEYFSKMSGKDIHAGDTGHQLLFDRLMESVGGAVLAKLELKRTI